MFNFKLCFGVARKRLLGSWQCCGFALSFLLCCYSIAKVYFLCHYVEPLLQQMHLCGWQITELFVLCVFYVKACSKCKYFSFVYCHNKSVKFNFLVWVVCLRHMCTPPTRASTVYMLTQWWRGGRANTILLNWYLIQILMPVLLWKIWQWCVQLVT